MGDHKYIWLAPKCARDHYSDDRCWCSTPEELVCEECGAKPIAYVRAGKPTAELVSDLAAAHARIAVLEASNDHYQQRDFGLVAETCRLNERLASLTSVSEDDVERAVKAAYFDNFDEARDAEEWASLHPGWKSRMFDTIRAALTAFVSR